MMFNSCRMPWAHMVFCWKSCADHDSGEQGYGPMNCWPKGLLRHLHEVKQDLTGDLGTSVRWNGPSSALQIQEQSVPELMFTSGKLTMNLRAWFFRDVLHHVPQPQWCERLCFSWWVRDWDQFCISLVGEKVILTHRLFQNCFAILQIEKFGVNVVRFGC